MASSNLSGSVSHCAYCCISLPSPPSLQIKQRGESPKQWEGWSLFPLPRLNCLLHERPMAGKQTQITVCSTLSESDWAEKAMNVPSKCLCAHSPAEFYSWY